MNTVLYISNWAFSEGLTQSTVLPNLEILAQTKLWDKIIFTTLELKPQEPVFLNQKISHRPFFNEASRVKLWDRFLRWKKYRTFLNNIITTEQVTCIIARGAPAAVIASDLQRPTGVPLYVESFEPHADYMEESGVWKKWDPRYIKQKLGERKVRQQAKGIITVSEKFKKHLQKQGLDPRKIKAVPCTVDTTLFQFSNEDRHELRKQLNIPGNSIVGINVGKYGSIYHDETAFRLFKFFFDEMPGYHQVFLTPDVDSVNGKISAFNLPSDRCRVLSVKNTEVPKYLSAADFGFVLVKSTPAKQFCSAIKTGEYWACGLPVVITERIGDDSDIVAETGTGVIWDASPGSMHKVVEKLEKILQESNIRERNRQLAFLHRDRSYIADSYSYFELI